MEIKQIRQAKFAIEDLLEYNTLRTDQERTLEDSVEVLDELLTNLDIDRDNEMLSDMSDYDM